MLEARARERERERERERGQRSILASAKRIADEEESKGFKLMNG